MFPRLRYIEWIRGRKAAATTDLGSSGLGANEDDVVPARLRGLSDPPEEMSLESLIADRYDDRVTPEHVLVAAGASHANVLAFAAALDSSAPANPSIVVERPAYEPLVETPAALGATVRRVDRDPARGYALDPAAVEEAVDETTAAVVVSNRHNPSGHRLDSDELRELAEVTRRKDTSLFVDEVYAPYHPTVRTGAGTAFGGPTAAGLEGVVVTNSLTKFFGFGGLCIGWLIADPAFVEAARTVLAHLPVVATPSRKLAERAFFNLEELLDWSRERVRENAATLSAFHAARSDLDGVVHDGSTFAFLEWTEDDGDRVSEAAFEDGILVVPGRFFDDPSRFRISLAGRPVDGRTGLDRFESVLDRLQEMA